MLNEKELKGLEKISQYAGNRADLVQGGGGNTSAKLDNDLMAVKASGFKLSQVKKDNGHVIVNYRDLVNYYQSVDLKSEKDFEKENSAITKKSIVKGRNKGDLRPSIETGFHAILSKYVLHTHSVYANILCCAKEGKKILKELYGEQLVWIPYTHPGFYLTMEIKEQLGAYLKHNSKQANIIFMENHGLIVTAEKAETCITLNEKINSDLKQHLNLKDYPQIRIDKLEEEEKYVSKNSFVKEFLTNKQIEEDFFQQVILYPDQIVYMGDSIGYNKEDLKININPQSTEITYQGNYSQALTMAETLLAYLYVIDGINKNGLTVQTMPQKYIDLIKAMEGEKYRQKIIKDMDDNN